MKGLLKSIDLKLSSRLNFLHTKLLHNPYNVSYSHSASRGRERYGTGGVVVFVHRGAGSTIGCRFIGATSTSAGRGGTSDFRSPLPQGFQTVY